MAKKKGFPPEVRLVIDLFKGEEEYKYLERLPEGWDKISCCSRAKLELCAKVLKKLNEA